jgi:hypothetical protein
MVSLRRASVATCPDTSGAGTGTSTFEVSDLRESNATVPRQSHFYGLNQLHF